MSIRIYIGNLPQGFNPKEFDEILKSVSDSIRFKAVLDKETKAVSYTHLTLPTILRV